MKLTVKVKKATILRQEHGTDRVSLEVELPTPFPKLDAREPGLYPAILRIDTQPGYAEEWLAQVGVSEVELFDYKNSKGVEDTHTTVRLKE